MVGRWLLGAHDLNGDWPWLDWWTLPSLPPRFHCPIEYIEPNRSYLSRGQSSLLVKWAPSNELFGSVSTSSDLPFTIPFFYAGYGVETAGPAQTILWVEWCIYAKFHCYGLTWRGSAPAPISIIIDAPYCRIGYFAWSLCLTAIVVYMLSPSIYIKKSSIP